MLKLKKELPRGREKLRSKARGYVKAFTDLALYKLRTGNVPTVEELAQFLASFEALCEAAKNWDRLQLRMCKDAEVKLRRALLAALSFVETVANESDIPAILAVGLELQAAKRRARVAVAPAS